MSPLRPASFLPALAAALLVLLLLPAAARAEEAAAGEPIARAERLLQEERYLEALQLLEQAYAQRQTPRLLYLLGRAHQRLGQAKEARTYYERFLAADLGRDPQAEQEAGRALQGLSAVAPAQERPTATQLLGGPRARYAGGEGVAMIPVQVEERPRHYGMLSAGISLLATGYVPALICGAIFAGSRSSSGPYSSSSNNAFATAGGLLIIPLVGPIISGIYYPSADPKSGAQYYWSLPWVLVDASVQVAGLILTVTGALTKQRVVRLRYDLSVAPYVTPTDRGLSLAGRF